MVRFKVLLDGKPLVHELVRYPFLTAWSPAFGAKWGLHSELEDGIGELRLPVGGARRIEVHYGGPASAVREFKSRPSGSTLWLESTFSFYLQP